MNCYAGRECRSYSETISLYKRAASQASHPAAEMG